MIRGSLSPPPQMGNGGLPPALLPSSTALDSPLFHSISDFPYVAAKWMHPPARAPKWMLEWTNNSIKWYTILGFCSPHHWIGRGRQEDLRFAATGEHPWPRHDSPVEAAYQAWKCAVDNMWQSHATLNKHHALIATRAKIETELARQARQHFELSAARTIFLWLRRRRLHARLVASLAVAVLADTRLCPQTAETRSPDLVPAEIRRIQAARDTLAAPLDALLAKFAALAVGTASPATASPVPTPSPRPRSYLDAVVGPNGRGYTSSAPPSPSVTTSHPSASAPPTPTVCTTHRAKPRHRTGRRNGPRAPSPPDEAKPSHPTNMMGGSLAMARAAPPCRSYSPSLQPFTFIDGAHISPGEGSAHPFCACGSTLPHRKHTRRKRRPHRVCRRHGPRAPNGHRPRAPNQYTRDGWAST